MNENWRKKSLAQQKVFRKLLQNSNKSLLIRRLPDLHEEAFSKINCLDCANCCKNHSPTFKSPDIKRISKHLRMTEPEFIETYLRLDEDNDFVVKHLPCVFLYQDHTCSIYNVRPSDCARYPYTNEDVFVKRPALTLANSLVCPAVFSILEKIHSES